MANKLKTDFLDGDSDELKDRRAHVLKSGLQFNEQSYKFDDKWVPGNPHNPLSVHSIPELIQCLEKNKNVSIAAKVICANTKESGYKFAKMGKDKFLEFAKQPRPRKMREAVDCFAYDQDVSSGSGLVGSDFIPLLGGPFNKQLYYTDYLRMHAASFHAYHHDPFGRATVNITRDFTVARGWRVIWESDKAKKVWRAFCQANKFEDMVEDISRELSMYGEIMVWELPNMQRYIVYDPAGKEPIPTGLIPRFRLIDPSAIWEVVTHPEDITRVLFYQWVAPTQFQMYTHGQVPGMKFIYQQVPGDQVLHYKVGAVSNEKRGRSDLFPALGYMKRLRDSVNYSIIALQKASAWSIDTTVNGSREDIDTYIEDQQRYGTVAPAGSEFVHTDAIKREYLSNEGSSRGGQSQAFDWCLSMIAVSTGIPVNYFGTHLSGAQTRASALVATEPVAKRMEKRQEVLTRIIKAIGVRAMKAFGIDEEPDIIWPEIVTEDRSIKLKDLTLAETNGWLSKKRAAEIAAKELNITEYNFDEEQKQIAAEAPKPDAPVDPLTSPGKVERPASGMSSDQKKAVKDNDGF